MPTLNQKKEKTYMEAVFEFYGESASAIYKNSVQEFHDTVEHLCKENNEFSMSSSNQIKRADIFGAFNVLQKVLPIAEYSEFELEGELEEFSKVMKGNKGKMPEGKGEYIMAFAKLDDDEVDETKYFFDELSNLPAIKAKEAMMRKYNRTPSERTTNTSTSTSIFSSEKTMQLR